MPHPLLAMLAHIGARALNGSEALGIGRCLHGTRGKVAFSFPPHRLTAFRVAFKQVFMQNALAQS